jgi:hypothetical protein
MEESEVGRIEAWVGLDVGKEDHHATVVSAAGERLFELAVRNDEAQVERLLDLALESGPCALVIDQPGSIGSLAVCLARRRGVPVAYVPGLVMRRASELYPGRGQDRPPRQLRARRHGPHSRAAVALARSLGRDARAAARAGRLRRRPRPRRQPHR